MPPSESLLLGLNSVREIISTTPIGYINAILSTALNIAEAVQANEEDDSCLQRLALRVLELSITCSRLMGRFNDSKSQDNQLYIGAFLRSLENIAHAVHKVRRRGFIGRMTGKLSKAKTVLELEEELEHSSALLSLQLQVRNHQMTSKSASESSACQDAAQEVIASAHREQLDLIRTRTMRAFEKRQKESSTFRHYPPPPPQHFFGRDGQVKHLVGLLHTVPSYQTVLGTGGIGKTCLSLRVFHDPRMITIYGRHRYFLSCEGIRDADGLAAGLANIFDLQENNVVSQLKRLLNIIGTSILVLLDNFETPWERSDTREKVEAILSDLTTIPNLSLLITLRGSERPAGVAWTRPFSPDISPLSLEESKQLFVSIADVQGDDPCLEDLVAAVEGLPLAVTLLATQAQSSSCSLLLSAWEEQKTSMVTRGFGGRLSCLDTSISLSIASLRMKGVESALPALQILSFLPDGATVDEIVQMNAGQENTALGGVTLCQVALAHFTGDRHLRLLSPIREYVRANYPANHELFERICAYHCKASRYAADYEISPDWKPMVDRLSSCIGNIHSILSESLLHESLASRGIQAAIDVMSFHRCAFLGSSKTLLKACLSEAKRSKFRKLEADCHFELASAHSHTLESHQSWETAISIYKELNDKGSLAKALCRCAQKANNMYQDSLAEGILAEAAKNLSDDWPLSQRIEFLEESGRLLTNTGEYSSAEKNYDEALRLINQCKDPWVAIGLFSSICFHYLCKDEYNSAIEVGQRGLAVPGLRDHWKNITVWLNIGMACTCLGRFSEAEKAFNRAFEISLRFGREYHMVWSKSYLAAIALASERLEDAELHLHAAWFLLQSTSDPLTLSLRLAGQLGQLELARNNIATANAHFDEMRRMGYKIGARHTTGLYYLVPKAFIFIRTGMTTMSRIYAICSIVWSRSGNQTADTAASLLVTGDTYILDEDQDRVTARSCYEVALGLLQNIGAKLLIAHALVRLAVVARLESISSAQLAKVAIRFNEVAKIFREFGQFPGERYCLEEIRGIEAGEKMVSFLRCIVEFSN